MNATVIGLGNEIVEPSSNYDQFCYINFVLKPWGKVWIHFPQFGVKYEDRQDAPTLDSSQSKRKFVNLILSRADCKLCGILAIISLISSFSKLSGSTQSSSLLQNEFEMVHVSLCAYESEYFIKISVHKEKS